MTLPRYLGVRNAFFKVGYPPEETARLRALLELGFDGAEPFVFGGSLIVPRDFAASFVGRRGLSGELTSNVKRVIVEGTSAGAPTTLIYDFAVDSADGSASSVITGVVAAIAADAVACGAGRAGVHAPEGAFDPQAFLSSLRERGFEVHESRSTGQGDP
jgi:saccharopine dehydrogenase-like NADP-dependent oxidoreductase